MAQRRMTSLEVTDTDAFLDMPASSQLLYFHLNSRADDDGFVANPKKVARTIGGNADDMKVLLMKKFIIAFDDGVCVIKHWRINNFVRKDIYRPTKYLDLKQTLFIRSNGAYTMSDDGRSVPVPAGHFKLEDVDVTLTSRQLRIGKDRIGKDSNTPSPDGDADGFEIFWKDYPRKIGKKNARTAWERIMKKKPVELDVILVGLARWKTSKQWTKDGGQFIQHPTTWLNAEAWNDEVQQGVTSKTDRFA